MRQRKISEGMTVYTVDFGPCEVISKATNGHVLIKDCNGHRHFVNCGSCRRNPSKNWPSPPYRIKGNKTHFYRLLHDIPKLCKHCGSELTELNQERKVCGVCHSEYVWEAGIPWEA